MSNSISLPGMTELPKKILVLRRRQIDRSRDISRSEENLEIQTNEVASTSEPVQAEAIVEVQQERKKRGRKSKSQTQPIQSSIDKGGRPPLVGMRTIQQLLCFVVVIEKNNLIIL